MLPDLRARSKYVRNIGMDESPSHDGLEKTANYVRFIGMDAGSGTSHLAARKTHKRKRMLRGTTVLHEEFTSQIVNVLAGNSY